MKTKEQCKSIEQALRDVARTETDMTDEEIEDIVQDELYEMGLDPDRKCEGCGTLMADYEIYSMDEEGCYTCPSCFASFLLGELKEARTPVSSPSDLIVEVDGEDRGSYYEYRRRLNPKDASIIVLERSGFGKHYGLKDHHIRLLTPDGGVVMDNKMEEGKREEEGRTCPLCGGEGSIPQHPSGHPREDCNLCEGKSHIGP